MTTYYVQWNYVSGYGGPWPPGEALDLTAEEAAKLNDDSPGVLKKTKPRLKAAEEPEVKVEEPEVEEPKAKEPAKKTTRAVKGPDNDRQVKAAPTRKRGKAK